MKTRLSYKDWERLSAYLDDQLSERERRQVEEQLRTRPEYREAWDSLRQTRHVLRQAPRHKAPRAFTLTPAMVTSHQPRPSLIWQLAPALAIFLVVLAVLLEWLPLPEGGRAMRTIAPSAPQIEALGMTEPTPTAVIVYWGGPPPPAGTMGMGGEGAADMGGGSSKGTVPEHPPLPPTTPAPLVVPPPYPSQPLTPPQATPEIRTLQGPANETPNPILGLPAPEERGKIYIATPSALPTPEGPRGSGVPLRRWIQAGLIGIALVLSTILLIRKSRS
ncbi:zf-HC2 domain-containing protein [uncultured Thermanaerothrix sp.]|uniref:anti-sigma factor family protein n=1 Tax=uncultured Thermanaerothrix sp. TaxID=1195149 RepID=UPI0026302D7F|nr:zf-HC2 domain-containing protein [uncultured Thermanaerothrix sp.]